jgi:hypothetical protein
MALLQPPLAERSVIVSESLRSPEVNPAAFERQATLSITLALRISRTAWLLNADHLCPFALWMALPSAPLETRPSRLLWALRFAFWSPSVGNPVFRHDETR